MNDSNVTTGNMVIFEEVEEHAQYTHNFRVDEPLNKSRFDESAIEDEGFPVRRDSLQILEEKGEMKDRYTRKNRHFQTNQLLALCVTRCLVIVY